ncbi:ABC transporter ATP-binding protein [Enterococcus sp. LJL120]
MKKVIDFIDVQKSFNKKIVLSIPQLQIYQQQAVGIIGKNGSGKSTLLKIASGLLYPNQGSVRILGNSSQHKRVKEKVRFVLESGQGYYDYLTARENMDYFLAINGFSLQKLKAEAKRLGDYLDFSQHMDKKVSALSQGNRQKMSLIIALLQRAPILALDEPTNGLDIPTKQKLVRVLQQYIQENMAVVLLTSHDVEFLRQFTTRILLLKDGRITFDDAPGILFRNQSLEKFEFQIHYQEYLEKSSLIANRKSIRVQQTEGGITTLICLSEEDKRFLLNHFDILNMSLAERTMEDIFSEVLTYG